MACLLSAGPVTFGSCVSGVATTSWTHSTSTPSPCAAIRPHLEELSLTLVSPYQCFVLPLTLFTCTNLVSLSCNMHISLCGAMGVHLPHSSAVCFPFLKMLQLNIDYEDSADVILPSCPILETLHLSYVLEFLTKVGLPPSLKRLKFTVERDIGTNLEIDAPGLEYLGITYITRSARICCPVGNLQNVVEAYLDVCFMGDSVDPLLKHLQAVSRTKCLVLGRSTTMLLLRAPALDFPDFHYLLRLELILPWFNSSFLVNVLLKCYMLQVLIIKNNTERPPLQSLVRLTNVPNCLVSHLSFIHFKGYLGFEDELLFAADILLKGLVLKTMIIDDIPLDLEEKYHIIKKLSVIPRGSSMCELKFD